MRVSPFAFQAAFAASVVLATGCARSWPTVRSVGDADFLAAGGVRTVDVLPLDVAVWVSQGRGEAPDEVADYFAASAEREIFAHLAGRGYDVAATIGPDGVYRRMDGREAIALAPEQLQAIEASLAAYGAAQQRTTNVLLTPYLPVRLGAATGADATLYVGGWTYAGQDASGVKAGDVAKYVLIGLFIVVIIAVAVVVARKGGGGGGGRGGGGGGGSAAGRAVGGAGSAAARAIGGTGRGVAHGVGQVARSSLDVLRAFNYTEDAWGRHHTHLNVYLSMPMAPAPQPPSGPSRTALEMTLIDNHRGVVLWHARQEFPASPANGRDVRDVIGSMMAGLPASR